MIQIVECSSCNSPNPAGAKFCGECGAGLAQACPACSVVVTSDQKFCHNCGHALQGRDRPAPTTQSALVESRLGEGELKTVTVLFADIADSTRLIEELDPETAAGHLQPAIEAMHAAVRRYSGTVNKVQGDGIMALFGAPIAIEDHAVMACRAALAMRDAVNDLDSPVKIRVGLHSGDVVVRTLGNDLSIDYDAIGPSVHLAGRMEQMAPPGKIFLTEQTYQLAAEQIQAHDCGPQQIKGVSRPIQIFELQSDRGVLTRWEARSARGISPLIGRERDMEAVLAAQSRVIAGDGQLVSLCGHAGIGKSRLVHELVHQHCHADTWQVMQFDADSYGVSISYRPISNFLRVWLGITPEDSSEAVREKLDAGVGEQIGDMDLVIPAIRVLLDLPVTDDAWAALDPPQRRQRIIDTLRKLVLARAQVKPVLLIFEDLHWMDSETLAVIDNIIQAISGKRVFAVITYRPGFTHTWADKDFCTGITMEPLGSEAVSGLLNHLIGAAADNDPLKTLLGTLSHGTPLFLEEMVRVLIEDGSLSGRQGRYVLTRDVAEVRIPDSVQAIIAARIDNLPAERKNLLQIASVIGRVFSLTLLEAVADMPASRVAEHVAQLEASEFIFATRVGLSAEYSFRHALTHEVAYNGALRERRRNLHRRVVEAMEARFADRQDEVIENLAHHAARAEDWQRAFTYLGRAGSKSLERSAYNEAVSHLEGALDAVKHLEADTEIQRRTIRLRLQLRAAFGPMGELDRMYAHLREAEADATALADDRLLAAVKTAQTFVFTLNGDLDDAIDAGRAALRFSQGPDQRDLRTTASVFLGQVLQFRGDFVNAAQALTPVQDYLRTEARFERLGTTSTTSVLAFYILASVFASMGRFNEALKAGAEALEIAEVGQRPYDLSLAYGGIGAAHFRSGNHAAALEAFERGREVCISGDIRSMFPWLSAQAGAAYALTGNHGKARDYLAEARANSRQMRLVYYHAWSIAFSGSAAYHEGDMAQAIAYLRQALEVADEHGYWAVSVWCLRHLGLTGDIWEASATTREKKLRHALDLAGRAEMRPEMAHLHGVLAALMDETGRADAMAEERAKAEALFRSLGVDPGQQAHPSQTAGVA